MSLLPAHLQMMRPWLARTDEIVVVDSDSHDGTVEYLKANLYHRRLRFLQHPPGLYQSWNFGLCQIQAPFAYVSAVGDSITGEGLAYLHEVAERLQCDVVVSRPVFLDAQRQQVRPPRWPIDDLCETLHLKEPVAIEGLMLFVFALANTTGPLLGSSASNLYRTACLQSFPFPTDYGTAGDAAWGLRHALDIRLGVATKVFSELLDHPKSYDIRHYAVPDLKGRLVQLALETVRRKREQDPTLDEHCRTANLDRLLAAVLENVSVQRELEQCRRRPVPWILNPRAWQVRRARTAIGRQVERLKLDCLRRLRPDATPSRVSASWAVREAYP